MDTLLPHRFKLKSTTGRLPVTEIYRHCYPAVDDAFQIFNYPNIELYAVERFDVRPDHWEHDHFEPVAIVLRPVEIVASAIPPSNVVALDGGGALTHRLASVGRVARRCIVDGLQLEICHDDFVTLCVSGHLDPDVARYDAFAYDGIPAIVGEAGARWNVATSFTGYSDDRHVLYVTLPGGAPFVMHGGFLSLTKAYADRRLSAADVLPRALELALESGLAVDEPIRHAVENTLELMREGLMPAYDTAQELTRILMPSESGRVRALWETSTRRGSALSERPSPDPVTALTLHALLSVLPKVPANQA